MGLSQIVHFDLTTQRIAWQCSEKQCNAQQSNAVSSLRRVNRVVFDSIEALCTVSRCNAEHGSAFKSKSVSLHGFTDGFSHQMHRSEMSRTATYGIAGSSKDIRQGFTALSNLFRGLTEGHRTSPSRNGSK